MLSRPASTDWTPACALSLNNTLSYTDRRWLGCECQCTQCLRSSGRASTWRAVQRPF